MSRRLELLIALGFALILFVDAVYLLYILPEAAYNPTYQAQGQYEEQLSPQGPVLAELSAFITCLISWLNANSGAVGAVAGIALVAFTAALSIATNGMLRATSKQAELAATAQRLSREIFESEQRPWVSADISLASGLRGDANGVNVALLFVLKNTGRSPALNVDVSPELYAAFGQIDVVARQRAMAEQKRQQPIREGGFGFTLFPGDHIPIQVGITLNKEHIDRWDKYMEGMGAKDYSFLPPVMILGCISYRFVFAPERHMTGFILDLHRIDPVRPRMHMAIPRPTEAKPEIAIGELVLGYSFIASGYTD